MSLLLVILWVSPRVIEKGLKYRLVEASLRVFGYNTISKSPIGEKLSLS